MRIFKTLLPSILIFLHISGCTAGKKENSNVINTRTFNLKFVAFNISVENPGDDSRCFYKIFIDKVEFGRTTIALESQKKFYDAQLTQDRHLITVEKWVLDALRNRYIKLNNILQPRPNFYYFDLPDNRTINITMLSERDGKTTFVAEFDNDLK